MSDDDVIPVAADAIRVVSDGGSPLLSRIFRALSQQRRRYCLYYLCEHDHATTTELAQQIAAWEQNIPVQEVSVEDCETVAVSLVQVHLPKLADEGLVEYDRRTDNVRYTYPPRLLDEALELAASIEGLS